MWFISCCKSNSVVSLAGHSTEKQTVISQSIGSIILWKTVFVTRHNIYYGHIVRLALVIPGLARTGTKHVLATSSVEGIYTLYLCAEGDGKAVCVQYMRFTANRHLLKNQVAEFCIHKLDLQSSAPGARFTCLQQLHINLKMSSFSLSV